LLGECREFARERSLATNLPIIEYPDVNPNFTEKAFETPGIFVVQSIFDEMDPGETRCFRRAGW
jgi:hypothetical protein